MIGVLSICAAEEGMILRDISSISMLILRKAMGVGPVGVVLSMLVSNGDSIRCCCCSPRSIVSHCG